MKITLLDLEMKSPPFLCKIEALSSGRNLFYKKIR